MGQRLTDVSIRRLPVPAKGNRIIYDFDVGGLGVRLTAGGAKLHFNYRTRGGRERRFTIGACADWTTRCPDRGPAAAPPNRSGR